MTINDYSKNDQGMFNKSMTMSVIVRKRVPLKLLHKKTLQHLISKKDGFLIKLSWAAFGYR